MSKEQDIKTTLIVNPRTGREQFVGVWRPHEMEDLWNRYQYPSSLDLRSAELKAHFDQTLSAPNRFTTGLEPSRKIYSGSWFCQGDEPTCMAWAVANSHLIVGATPNFEFLAILNDHARGVVIPGRLDLSFNELEDYLTKVDQPAVRIRKPDPVVWGYPAGYGNQPDKASDIKSSLHNGKSLIVGVRSGFYFPIGYVNPFSRESHAICISGYEVLENGFMDVWLTDSNYGIFKTSLEFLNRCIIENSARIVEKAD